MSSNSYWVHDFDDPNLIRFIPTGEVSMEFFNKMLPGGFSFHPVIAVLNSYFYMQLKTPRSTITLADESFPRLVGRMCAAAQEHPIDHHPDNPKRLHNV